MKNQNDNLAEELRQKAREKFSEMMARSPFAERMEPVFKEQLRLLPGNTEPQPESRILPDYCYNIIALQRRTVFHAYPNISEVVWCSDKAQLATCKTPNEAKKFLSIDWYKFGVIMGIAMRAIRFAELEAQGTLKKMGLLDLSESQWEEIGKLLVSEPWLERKIAEIEAQDLGKSVEEIIENAWLKMFEKLKAAVPHWSQIAYEWSPEAMAEFNRGMAKGNTGFIDESGLLRGEDKMLMNDTYSMLLIAWPEIQDMMRAKPAKSRTHLWDWLTPFRDAKWVEIRDLDNFIRLCDSIKLRLKSPGAPRKAR